MKADSQLSGLCERDHNDVKLSSTLSDLLLVVAGLYVPGAFNDTRSLDKHANGSENAHLQVDLRENGANPSSTTEY